MALYHDNDRLPGYLTNKEIAILNKYMVEASVKCKCGHTVLVPRRVIKKYVLGVVTMYLEIKKMSSNID